MGVTLFERSRQGTILTFEGKKIMSIVKELLEKAQELKEEAHQFQNEISGVLRVSAIPGLMKILLKVFSKFKKKSSERPIKYFGKRL